MSKRGLGSKVSTKNYYIVYNTTTIPKEMGSILDGSVIDTDIDLNGTQYFVSTAPLTDISKKNLGYFILLTDVTVEHSVMNNSMKLLTIFLVLLTFILLVIGFVLINNREKKIFKLTMELDRKNEKLQKLFDVQKNIVVISDGVDTSLVNKATLKFFNIESIEDFQKHYKDISEMFIVTNGYFSLEQIAEEKNWIELLQSLTGDKKIVTMKDAKGVSHAFSVAISQFENRRYLLAFSDISATMIEKIDLSQKIERDELTAAFNRQFLNNHITSIIKNLENNKYLGVGFLDIDHFKNVNDTYGHNVGDVVLKQFANSIKASIRSDDFLIRWGGEEFIVLMKTTSIEALFRVAEHIRNVIEKSSFDTVGTITCSIGVTLYCPGENINNTIQRADNAMYTSKVQGRNRVHKLLMLDEHKKSSEEKYIKAVLDEDAIIVDFECNILDEDGYTSEDVIGKNWFDLFLSENDKEETQNYFKSILAKSVEEEKHTNDIICKDGTHRLLDFYNTTIIKDGKKYLSFIAKEHFSK